MKRLKVINMNNNDNKLKHFKFRSEVEVSQAKINDLLI